MKTTLLILAFLIFLSACSEKQPPHTVEHEIYTNPLLKKGQDPWIIQEGGYYYYCFSAHGSIGVQKVRHLTELRTADTLVLWTPPSGTDYSRELWAPELHRIQNKWYVYVAADDGKNENHRMHVLQSQGTELESGFEYVGQLQDPDNKWAIDGTVLNYQDRWYFIWSGWEGEENVAQNLYIAAMESPTKISSKRVMISQPDQEWEQRGSGDGLPTINEGPQVLQKDGGVFIIYSASGSWSNDYCLGMLTLSGDDPLRPGAWSKSEKPVFEGTDCVISPGHCSFFTIGDQDWILYHVTGFKNGGWDSRYVKMQPFYWKEGIPTFGKPVEDGVLLPL